MKYIAALSKPCGRRMFIVTLKMWLPYIRWDRLINAGINRKLKSHTHGWGFYCIHPTRGPCEPRILQPLVSNLQHMAVKSNTTIMLIHAQSMQGRNAIMSHVFQICNIKDYLVCPGCFDVQCMVVTSCCSEQEWRYRHWGMGYFLHRSLLLTCSSMHVTAFASYGNSDHMVAVDLCCE